MPGHVLYQDMVFFEGVGSDPAMSDTGIISTSEVTFIRVAMKEIPYPLSMQPPIQQQTKGLNLHQASF